jgi:hypothetical protein
MEDDTESCESYDDPPQIRLICLAFAQATNKARDAFLEHLGHDVCQVFLQNLSRDLDCIYWCKRKNEKIMSEARSNWRKIMERICGGRCPSAPVEPSLEGSIADATALIIRADAASLEWSTLDDMFPEEVSIYCKKAAAALAAAEDVAAVRQATVADLLALPRPTLDDILRSYSESTSEYTVGCFEKDAALLRVGEVDAARNALFGRKGLGSALGPDLDVVLRVFLNAVPKDTLCEALFGAFPDDARVSGWCEKCVAHHIAETRASTAVVAHALLHSA